MRRAHFAACVVVIAVCADYDAASAQDATSKWDVEVHAGLSSTRDQVDGSGGLPATGTIVQGAISASTFYLGDGARLFNENQRSVIGTQAASTIVPLDAVVASAATTRERGPAVGVRLEREVMRRFAVQVDGDLSLDHLAFTPGALTAIETTRASYTSALERALSVSPLASAVTSVATITDHQFAPQLFATAALVANLKLSGRTIPYVAGGGGVVFNWGSTPSAKLVGNYELDKPPQLLGTDTVSLTYGEDSLTRVGFGGGGFTHDLASKWGIRVDAREYLYRNSGKNGLDVTPALSFQSTGQPFPHVDAGALKFATSAPLNGSAVSGSTTFSGSGLQGHLIVSAGLVLRF
jgi:hypothetical protein